MLKMDKELTKQIEEYIKNGGLITKCPDIGTTLPVQHIEQTDHGQELSFGGYYVRRMPSSDEQFEKNSGRPTHPA